MKTKVRIEVPKYSKVKYEINENGELIIDRVLYGAQQYPQNYGFIDNTLDFDGDPLDAIVIGNEAWVPNTILDCRILGLMPMIDEGFEDSKLICVIENDPRFENIQTIVDVDNNILNEIINFFETYKVLEKKMVKVEAIRGIEDAKKCLTKCKKIKKLYLKLRDEKDNKSKTKEEILHIINTTKKL